MVEIADTILDAYTPIDAATRAEIDKAYPAPDVESLLRNIEGWVTTAALGRTITAESRLRRKAFGLRRVLTDEEEMAIYNEIDDTARDEESFQHRAAPYLLSLLVHGLVMRRSVRIGKRKVEFWRVTEEGEDESNMEPVTPAR
jgi:hypothetical protein